MRFNIKAVYPKLMYLLKKNFTALNDTSLQKVFTNTSLYIVAAE